MLYLEVSLNLNFLQNYEINLDNLFTILGPLHIFSACSLCIFNQMCFVAKVWQPSHVQICVQRQLRKPNKAGEILLENTNVKTTSVYTARVRLK